MNYNIDEMKSWLRDYIDDVCIYRVAPGERLLPSKDGKTYTWQFYLRRGLFNSQFCSYLGTIFWSFFQDDFSKEPFQITGRESGATPIISSILMKAPIFGINLNAFSTRDERKKYGLFNRFEGVIDYELPVLIVDDLSNSKNTILKTKEDLEKEGLRVYSRAFTILNKDIDGNHPDHDKYIGSDLKIRSIFNLNDFHSTWKSYEEHCQVQNKEKIPFRIENYRLP